MKAIHLTAYGNPAQGLRIVDVSEPDTPSAGVSGNYLGFPDGISGWELASRARQQAQRLGAEIIVTAEGVGGETRDGWTVSWLSGELAGARCSSNLLASTHDGCSHRLRSMEGFPEKRIVFRGIHYLGRSRGHPDSICTANQTN